MHRLFFLFTALFFTASLPAQLVMDTARTPQALVEEVLLGNRVRVNNIRVRGKKFSYAGFKDESIKPLIGEGIVFTTGSVFDVIGPNKRASTGRNMGIQGDKALFYLADGPTYDATGIEFDFIPEYETFQFNYFFGSEEYTEYVNSQFNDVFAFFITGPGYNRNTNLAVVPGHRTPITINTIHPGKNKDFYIDNNPFNSKGYRLAHREDDVDSVWSQTFELDGFTKLMQIKANVQPGKVYHIKIVIADVNDGAFDSAVFLEAGSFTSLPADPMQASALQELDDVVFRRAFEPGILGKQRPRPGPVLLELEGNASVDFEMETAKDSVAFPREDSAENGLELALVVEFALDSDRLTPEAKDILRTLGPQIKAKPGRTLLVEGHTCDRGNRAYNRRLSRARAESVAVYLRQIGIDPDRIEVRAADFSNPRAPNTAEANRSLNRRVEIRWTE